MVWLPGPEVIKLFSCSTQLSIKFFLLIKVKMPTFVGILTFMRGKNSILGLSEPKKAKISQYFYTYEHSKSKFHPQLSWAWKKFCNFGACTVNWVSQLPLMQKWLSTEVSICSADSYKQLHHLLLLVLMLVASLQRISFVNGNRQQICNTLILCSGLPFKFA